MESRVCSQATIGRQEPLGALERMLAAAAAGQPQLAVIGGEAGIGKTRMVEEAEARARALGFLVLHGEAVEFGGEEFAYAPIVAALRDLPPGWAEAALEGLSGEARHELAALLPRLPVAGESRFSSDTGQGRLYELVLDLLGRLAREQAPLLIVLEDLHWADRSSRDLLAFFARNLRAERIAVLATYRTDELESGHPLRRALAELVRRANVLRIDLAPLDRAEVGQQLEAIAGRPVPASVADELHALASGNPFFVEELYAARREGAGVPASVAEAVLVRVERLEGPAGELPAIVAAAGGRVGYEVLERLAPGAAGLRAALDAGILVRERGDRGVGFRHGLMGEVIYRQLLPTERTALHRAIAGALAEEPGAPAAQLAYQWHQAGAHADALAASVTAGLEAARLYAFAEARGHLERALELWDRVSPAPGSLPVDKVELLARAAQAARFTGDRARAVELCRAALAQLDHAAEPARAARLYERLGEYHFWDDRMALEYYEQALRLLESSPSADRARLLAAEGHALMGLRCWEEARRRCEAALAVAEEAGAAAEEPAAGITLGLVLAFLGEADAGEAHLRRALETAQRLDAGEDTARAHMHLGELLRLRGDHAGALATMIAGEEAAARLGMRGSFGHFMFVNAAEDLLRLGRWDEALARLAEAERMDLSLTAAAMLHATAGQLHAQRGETALARAHLEAAGENGEPLPSEFVTPIAAAWATLALTEGDPEAARRHVGEALAAVGEAKDTLYTPLLHSLGARAEAEIAERERARRRAPDAAPIDALLAELDAILARGTGDARPPDALAHRALVHAERARVAGVPEPERWRAAGDAWDALGEPYPAAYARLREAEATLQSSGERAAAAAPLAAAHATAEALGAAPLRTEIQALARRARLDPTPPPRPPAPSAADEAGLTAREAEVLALLADGLTNREIAARLFISQKTVAAHMAHIFGKLDVHTRVEAAARAQRLGVVER